jgi:hypothetical protein
MRSDYRYAVVMPNNKFVQPVGGAMEHRAPTAQLTVDRSTLAIVAAGSSRRDVELGDLPMLFAA